MEFLKVLKKNKLAMIGLIIISVFTIMALGAPFIAVQDPTEQNLDYVLKKPDHKFFLGTDELGRDIYSRVIWGARNSLIVGILVVLLGGSLGVIIGTLSGYCGGPVDTVLMRIMDTMMSFPTILLSLLIVTIIGIGLEGAIIAVGLASVPRFARITRGSV
ncbi:MAG: ABC transporter permease, partial [Deltaproteobacteria bacterium]|nr:ABC transporter permease [Deltaproteobacteria bacterium]